MTRFRASWGLATLLLAACSGIQENHPTALSGADPAAELETLEQAGNIALVTGSAHLQVFASNGFGLRKLTFSAIEHADGSVSGEWNIVAGASILHGDIDCMTILPGGKAARITGVVTNALFTTFQVGTAFAIELTDNGNGQSGDPDANTEVRAFRNAPIEVAELFCATGEAPGELDVMVIEKGNLSIQLLGQ